MTNQLPSLARRDYFYLDAFWRVNLGMYVIKDAIFKKLARLILAYSYKGKTASRLPLGLRLKDQGSVTYMH